jgi:hypothetical protein
LSSRHRLIPATLVGVVCAIMTTIGVGTAAAAGPVVPGFSGERALELIREQCALGPRTPGSPGNLELRRLIEAAARTAGLRVVPVCFEAPLGPGGSAIEACNLVVSAGPSGGERLWLGAHFDTRPWADRDPSPPGASSRSSAPTTAPAGRPCCCT